MTRGVFDVLRRGFDNAVANWQIAVIRFVEALIMGVIAIASVFAVVVPIIVSFGIHMVDLQKPENIEGAMDLLAAKWILIAWIFIAISIMFLLFIAVHSFVDAGAARVFIDGDRIAGPENLGPRNRFRVFSLERFFAGAKDGWWAVFWIYNLAWGLAGLILLIPLGPTLALVMMFLFRESLRATAVTGCLGLAITALLFFPVAIVTNLWTTRAIVDRGVQRAGAREALSTAWRAIRTDFARHLLAALAIFIVTLAGAAFFSSFGMFAAFSESFGRHALPAILMTIPLRIAGSLLNSAFSAMIGSWYIASFAAIALDPRR